jgi:endoglucanase
MQFQPRLSRACFVSSCLACSVLVACGSGSISREQPVDEEQVWEPPSKVPAGSPVARHGQLRLEGTQITDENGKPYQLRGVSTQWLNFDSAFSGNPDNLAWMRDNWNVSLIRGAMGVEMGSGYLSDAGYMTKRIEDVIHHAIDAGTYVLVDWHDHNATMHQSEAVSFFKSMAKKWGKYPNIIWETFNEPTFVDWQTELKPYHEAVVAAIRSEDPDNIIVLGDPIWSQQPNIAVTAGGETADGGVLDARVEGENLMYTLHFYACTHGADVRANGQAALDAGLPVFVTEWGATTADGGLPDPKTGAEGQVCEAEAQAWMDWMNENKISWAAWRLQACPDASCILESGASYSGGWGQEDLHGHGPFVVKSLLE